MNKFIKLKSLSIYTVFLWGLLTSLISLSQEKLLITVIDTGIDLKNSELGPYLWINPGESGMDNKNQDKSHNGIDDDQNGFIDDVHGWNFAQNNSNIQDVHGHGTHVTSIILETLKKLKKSESVKVQILKYFSEDTPNLLSASNNAFKYAQHFNPSLINYSGGGFEESPEEKSILQEFKKLGTLIVAASGNHSTNIDQHPYFPASYHEPFIFSVGATTNNRLPANFSNYGKKNMDFFAPGVLISGFLLDSKKGFLSGTSQATALVTALSAFLILENKQTIESLDLKKFFCENGDSLPSPQKSKMSRCEKYLDQKKIGYFRGKSSSVFNN